MQNLKCDTNEPIYKTETDSQAEIRLVVAKGMGRGMDWEFGVSRCKLLHLEWTNNKVLLYSTGNMKKKYIYIYTYICIYLNHFAVQQKLTQNCKSTILQ